MTNLAVDSFVRSDQSGTWGTASDGQVWTRDVGIGQQNIVSNQGRIGPGGNDSHIVIGSGTAATVNLLCRIKSGGTGNVAALLFRYSSTSGTNVNGYRVGLFNSTLMVDRYINGARTGIGSFTTSYVIGEEWWVRAVAVGSTITASAWKDGTAEPASPQLTITDTNITSAGQYGVSVFMAADFTYFDSLTITDNQSTATTTTVSITESNALTEQWAITGATVSTESSATNESLSVVLGALPTETITLTEAKQLVMSLVKSETNPLTESFFAGVPPVAAPTHATITLTSPRGTLTLLATRGTITLEATRGDITLEGI